MAPAPPASADPTSITGDDWSVTLEVPDTRWEDLFQLNFTPCNDLAVTVTVSAPPGTSWTVSGVITPSSSATAIENFTVSGSGPAQSSIPGIQMCEHFNLPSAPPDDRYLVTGTATVPSGTPASLPFAAEFTIAPMPSYVMLLGHELRANASVFFARVSQNSSGFMRPVTGGSLVLDRLEGSSWIKAGDGVWTGEGTFAASAGSILPTGSYIRLRYLGDYSVAANDGLPWPVFAPYVPPAPPAPVVQPAPTARVKIKAVSARSKLKVDVNPNLGTKYWTFQVQRKNADGTWKAHKTYRTQGSKETRTVNLRRGTYRVWVNPKLWYQGAMSPNEVTLRR